METKLAYKTSYINEYDDGRIVDRDEHTRFFATREQAVAHAQYLTDNATEMNGVFTGEWMTPYAEMLEPEDRQTFRVIATVETVTLDEIEAQL